MTDPTADTAGDPTPDALVDPGIDPGIDPAAPDAAPDAALGVPIPETSPGVRDSSSTSETAAGVLEAAVGVLDPGVILELTGVLAGVLEGVLVGVLDPNVLGVAVPVGVLVDLAGVTEPLETTEPSLVLTRVPDKL